ncbi:MAG: ribose ABC transporter permease [Streptosporangiales bacterium]|nr:ribose ABC transporter permease [Streptosporangiales bacterium]
MAELTGRAEPAPPPWSYAVRDLVVRFAPQLLLVVLVVALLLVEPSTLRPGNIVNVLVAAAPIATLALGAMWVFIGGGLDLSAGYGVAMCALVLGANLQGGTPLGVAVGQAVLAGMLLGLTNGVLVGVVGMPAFIATLATMVCVQGVTLVLGGVGTVIIDNAVLTLIGTGELGGVPTPILYALGVAVLVWVLLRSSAFGLRTYALGSNREAAVTRGVPAVRQDVLVYVFSGLMTAVTAILLVARVQIVDPKIAGLNLLLDAFAAAILGGTSLFGGRGSVFGTVTGALIISLITTSLVTLGVGAQNVQLLKGAMIVVAVVVDALVRALERQQPASVEA